MELRTLHDVIAVGVRSGMVQDVIAKRIAKGAALQRVGKEAASHVTQDEAAVFLRVPTGRYETGDRYTGGGEA